MLLASIRDFRPIEAAALGGNQGSIRMANRSRHAALLSALSAIALFTLMTAAFSQVTDAQRAAIRSACRADYQSHCASVPPGGMESLQCLQKNLSSLAPGCQAAVRAVAQPAETKTEPKTETKTETTSEPKAQPAPATATSKSATEPGAAPAAAPAAPALSLRPMQPREQLFVLRSACGADVRALCGGVAPGGGRMMQCLVAQSASLSPECRAILARFVAP